MSPRILFCLQLSAAEYEELTGRLGPAGFDAGLVVGCTCVEVGDDWVELGYSESAGEAVHRAYRADLFAYGVGASDGLSERLDRLMERMGHYFEQRRLRRQLQAALRVGL